MILVIIGMICLAIGVILAIVGNKIYLSDLLCNVMIITMMLGITTGIAFGTCQLCDFTEKIEFEEEYTELVMFRDMAEDEDPVTIYKINEKIDDWNDKVERYERHRNSPWLNWFLLSNKTENVDYIELVGLDAEE